MDRQQAEPLYKKLEQRVLEIAKSLGAELTPKGTPQPNEEPYYLDKGMFIGVIEQIPYTNSRFSMKLPKGSDYTDHPSARGVEYEVLLRRALFSENVEHKPLSPALEAVHLLGKYGLRNYSSAMLTRRMMADKEVVNVIDDYKEPVFLLGKIRIQDRRGDHTLRISRPLIIGPRADMIDIDQWERDNSQCFEDGYAVKLNLGPFGRTTFCYQKRVNPTFR